AQGGKVTFPIPQSEFEQKDAFKVVVPIDLVGTICEGGPNPKANPPRCTAVVNLGEAAFKLDAIKPNAVELSAVIPVELDDTPVRVDANPGPVVGVHVGYGANGTCVGQKKDQVSVNPKALPVRIRVPLVAETTSPRTGYTKVDVDAAEIDLDAI